MSPPVEAVDGEVSVIVALGSNLGERLENLRAGVRGVSDVVAVDRVSSVYESEPVGYREQPPFLNAVLAGRTRLSPHDLMDVLLSVEALEGRQRVVPGGPRTLDLDLIFYGERIIDSPGLAVPHPRWRDRAFVRVPLEEIEPGRIDPVSGLEVRAVPAPAEPGDLQPFAPASALESET